MEGRAELALGLASSVGPVPFASADEAVDFSLRLHGRFPTVPVTTSREASLLAQAVSGVPAIAPSRDGDGLVIDGRVPSPDDVGAAAGSVDGPAFGSLHVMAERLAGSSDVGQAVPVRVPVLGPVTLAAHLHLAGVPLSEAAAVATAAVASRSVAALDALRRDATGRSEHHRPVTVVLCEPALVGSMHPTFPLLPARIRAILDPVVDALDRSASRGPLLIGVHVPGPCDWSTVVGSGASFLCLPVDRSVAGWAGLFGDLLERGGRICWGVVPVDRPIGSSADPHWRRLIALWTTLVSEGVDPMLLRLRSSFSPADGLGRFGTDQAALVMDLTVGVAERIRHQAVAARLSLGA